MDFNEIRQDISTQCPLSGAFQPDHQPTLLPQGIRVGELTLALDLHLKSRTNSGITAKVRDIRPMGLLFGSQMCSMCGRQHVH